MARWVFALAAALGLLVGGPVATADPVTFRVNTDKVANRVSRLIYGHFFEHIYNGGDNGLWGEMVWNRSFEYQSNTVGKWENKNDIVSQTALGDGIKTLFGNEKWKDYDFTVEARKT